MTPDSDDVSSLLADRAVCFLALWQGLLTLPVAKCLATALAASNFVLASSSRSWTRNMATASSQAESRASRRARNSSRYHAAGCLRIQRCRPFSDQPDSRVAACQEEPWARASANLITALGIDFDMTGRGRTS